jgi:hypothetical protein
MTLDNLGFKQQSFLKENYFFLNFFTSPYTTAAKLLTIIALHTLIYICGRKKYMGWKNL